MEDRNTNVATAMRELGATLKLIRKTRKQSRAEFGRAVGIAEKTVQNIEKGEGFTMESFLLILGYTSMDRPLFAWLKENATTVDNLV